MEMASRPPVNNNGSSPPDRTASSNFPMPDITAPRYTARGSAAPKRRPFHREGPRRLQPRETVSPRTRSLRRARVSHAPAVPSARLRSWLFAASAGLFASAASVSVLALLASPWSGFEGDGLAAGASNTRAEAGFRIVSVEAPVPMTEPTAGRPAAASARSGSDGPRDSGGDDRASAGRPAEQKSEEASLGASSIPFDLMPAAAVEADDTAAGGGVPRSSSQEGRPQAATDEGREPPGGIRGPRAIRRTRVLEISGLKGPDDKPAPPRRVVKPAEPTHMPMPKYPPQAEKREIQGFVRVKVLISPEGTVARHELLEAEPSGVFEKSITDVLPLWRYAPAVVEAGKPIEFWSQHTFQFKLEAQ